MTHPNEQTVREGFTAFSTHDQETLRRVIAVDAVWHVPGRSALAGSYKGIEEILGFFGKTAALSEGTFATDIHDVAANDDHVFVAYTASAQRGEKSLRDNAVLLFHVQDGKVTEAWGTAGDQYANDDFWG